MDNKRLKVLLDLYLDEGLDSETKQELEQILLSSPQAREAFWEQANLNSMLRQVGQESWSPSESFVERSETQETQETPTGQSVFQQRWVIAASCLLALSLAWLLYSSNRRNADPIIAGLEPQASSESIDGQSDFALPVQENWVAIVRKTVNAEWAKGERPLQGGEAMGARRLRLERGLVEVQTIRGALLTLQGPADLEIVNDMEVLCHSGKLRVDVPPSAIGFQVNTPHIDVVDLGTSFAVDVDAANETEVHVLEGKVELLSESANIPAKEFVEGQAVEVTDGVMREFPSIGSFMPSASQVDSRALAASQKLRVAWERRRDAIAQDPSCIAYFDFQNESPQGFALTNRAPGASPDSNGTIVGCEWAQGRWPGKRALDFKSTFDRVLFDAPGEYDTLTCMASLRLDSIAPSGRALLMPSYASDRSFSWQVSPASSPGSQAQLQFGRFALSGGRVANQYSGSLGFRGEQLGTWAQYVVVWDSVGEVCSQYVNGNLVSRDYIQSSGDSKPMLVRTGKLVIGNSGLYDVAKSTPLSHFVGRIDELAIFNRALPKEEVLALQELDKIAWANGSKDGDWNERNNWPAGITPAAGDAVYIDRAGDDALIYSEGESPNLNEIRVGSMDGLHGELRITGGKLRASKSPVAASRVGVAGGHGVVIQEDGDVSLNTLQVGLDEESQGHYALEGGSLLIARGIRSSVCSLDLGVHGGVGTFDVKGGSLKTRIGVSLGSGHGSGQFSVYGSRAKEISIGAHGSGDGSWDQQSNSTLRAMVDAKGLTPIVIHDAEEDVDWSKHGDVTFATDALLDVGFVDEPRSGSWDVMTWHGELIDNGLVFSPEVDTNIWAFGFVDTNTSGTPDTLRITANVGTNNSK